ncbi:hypothetical protein Nepgr_000372 [Nepenthes gracilis]|uniref:Plus3 domain-containing protein n=1 Tax=Nepenthes gracilis TaxID=150966 RepID=A0AAD3RWS3_NEPGR|nr:hypothetical protein Nepgr_000372 [Nepenthes gracilis]
MIIFLTRGKKRREQKPMIEQNKSRRPWAGRADSCSVSLLARPLPAPFVSVVPESWYITKLAALEINMADLENLLLEAAGRTSGSGRNKHLHRSSRCWHPDSYPGGVSDSKDNDSEDCHDYTGRKASRSHVPLKKRSKTRESQDDEDEDQDGLDHQIDSSDDSDVGSDLYRDEDDRQQLARLTELERELILSDRASKKDDKKLQKQMKSRWTRERKSQPEKETSTPVSSRGLRTSARFADKTPAKADALNVLRARRKRDPDAEQRLSNTSTGIRGSHTYSPISQKRFAASSPIGSSESGSEIRSDDGGSTGDGRMDYSDEERSKPEAEIPTFEDIKGITIRRSKLGKWFMEPFFDDLIAGCFVRVGIGVQSGQNIYRLCIVQNVELMDPSRQYELEKKVTSKYLNCVWGSANSAAQWQMARISDSIPSKEEFNQWVEEVDRSGGRMPSREEVLEKKGAIEKINNFVYSAAMVKQMLQEKKSVSTRPLNIAAEKEKLRREMEVARYKNDEAEAERITAKLLELKAVQQPQEKDEKALRLAEMNRKNRAENFRTASVSKQVSTRLKAGDAGYDPFSRRWTMSRNYYATKMEGVGDAAASAVEAAGSGDATKSASADSNNGTKNSAEAGMATTEAALEAAAGAGKLVDTSAPVDQGTVSNILHNFDLPISLARLQKFGGPLGAAAAFLARKQRVEATVGFQVPEDDGKRHLLTLTLQVHASFISLVYQQFF